MKPTKFIVIPRKYVYVVHEHANRLLIPKSKLGQSILGFKHHRILGVFLNKANAEKAKIEYELNNPEHAYVAVTKHKLEELKVKI